MEVTQIYDLVNSVVSQGVGLTELTVVDTNSLVALGDTILGDNKYTENFINTLVDRIGKTILSFRKYTNKLADMVLDDFEYGALVQKIKVEMPEVEVDESILENGKSVDMYKVSKPKARQTFFSKETPYQIKITIQRKWLKQAFISESAMGGFISAVFGEVQNKLDLTLETLGRACIANFAVNTTNVRNLVSEFNSISGKNLTAEESLHDSDFLRFAVAEIKKVSKKMTEMSRIYNDGSADRHTPFEMQKIKVLSDFETQLETVVQYMAFNEKFVSLNGFQEFGYWQSIKDCMSISAKNADNEDVTIENVVAIIHDKDALGMYKKEELTSTTPFNSAGLYTNTYWHEQQMWFNDLSENFVLFTLN